MTATTTALDDTIDAIDDALAALVFHMEGAVDVGCVARHLGAALHDCYLALNERGDAARWHTRVSGAQNSIREALSLLQATADVSAATQDVCRCISRAFAALAQASTGVDDSNVDLPVVLAVRSRASVGAPTLVDVGRAVLVPASPLAGVVREAMEDEAQPPVEETAAARPAVKTTADVEAMLTRAAQPKERVDSAAADTEALPAEAATPPNDTALWFGTASSVREVLSARVGACLEDVDRKSVV